MIRVTFDLHHDAVVSVQLGVTVPTDDPKTARDEAERYLTYLLSGKAKARVALGKYPVIEEMNEAGDTMVKHIAATLTGTKEG